MVKKIRCEHCRKMVAANPRVKDQRYCGRKQCQQARKTKWHQKKMNSDAEYAQNQNQLKQRWGKKNPGYWDNYRKANPEYTNRNRELQNQRDQKRRQHSAKMDASDSDSHEMDASVDIFISNTGSYDASNPDLAKMDTLQPIDSIKPGIYRIHQKKCDLAKMDASKTNYLLIPLSYNDLAKMDKIDIRIGYGQKSPSKSKTGGQL